MLQKLVNFVEPCVKESNANPAAVEKLIRNSEFSDDKNLKCFIKCLYTKAGVMSDDGKFSAEELKKTLEDGDSPDVINKCKDLKGSDNCDTAFLVSKCIEGK